MEKQTIHNKNEYFFCYRKSRKHLFQVTSAYSKIFADDLGPYTLERKSNAECSPFGVADDVQDSDSAVCQGLT